MESLLGFEEEDTTTIIENKSCGYKLVPWLSWDEWDVVRESLFSLSPLSVASSLSRISAWRSRGCLPVVVDVTASIMEIQQKDPFFRVDQTDNNLHSEDMLAMLYCMAIMRLVNGVVEKTRKKTEISIAEAADAIGIPRMLIDIRHEGSHRDLPSLRLLRLASVKALDWLKSYYWDPQQKAIVFQIDGTAHIRMEIKSKLHELVFCLKAKKMARSSSSVVKEKGSDSKKQITKMMKTLVRLYSSFSSEVVSVLLEYMLEASDALDLVENPKNTDPLHLVENPKNSLVGASIDNSLNGTDEWKLMITKLSNKEPKLLPTLLKAVLDMIETQKAVEYEIGNQQLISLENKSEDRQVELLSSLFAWLVRILKVLKPSRRKCSSAENEDCSADTLESSATMVELMRRALLVSDPGNEQLMGSVLNLAHMTGNRSLIEKLNKLSLITSPYTHVTEQNPPFMPMRSENLHIQQEDYIRQAAEKLEVLKLKRIQRKSAMTIECKGRKSNGWVIAKSWNRCAIGMLPRAIGSSGCLPVLDICDDDCKGVVEPSESIESSELNRCGKRDATCDIEMLDNSNGKKMRETVEECEMKGDDAMLDGVEGQLMIDGVWRKVEEKELLAIRSAIKIFPLPKNLDTPTGDATGGSADTPTGDATGGGRAVAKARKRKASKEHSDTPTGDAAGGGRAVAKARKKADDKQKKKVRGSSDTPTGGATGGGADTPTGDATGGGSNTPTGDATGGGSAVAKARKRKAYKEERKKKARSAQL